MTTIRHIKINSLTIGTGSFEGRAGEKRREEAGSMSSTLAHKAQIMPAAQSIIRPLDLEMLRQQARTATPFPFITIDHFLEPDFAEQVWGAFPPYSEAVKAGRVLSTVNEAKKVTLADVSGCKPPILQLNAALATSEFCSQLSHIFDIPNVLPDEKLTGGGIHQTGPRGRLDVHVDFNYISDRKLHRRLNILLYFNKGWKAEWGGNVELWDKDVKNCHHSFAPSFNRCVIFETSEISYHGVTAVRCPLGESRKSFAAYYYTREAPAGWDGKTHSTVFRARPNEIFKGSILMPAEKVWRGIGRLPKKIKRMFQ